MVHLPHSNDGILWESREILNELHSSKDNGNSLGIWAPRLGDGVFICTIESIYKNETENDHIIIVTEKNLDGLTLNTHMLFLREIRRVHRFKKLS